MEYAIIAVLFIILFLSMRNNKKLWEKAKTEISKNNCLKMKIEKVAQEIECEIWSRSQYPNVGKKGCVRRLRQILEEESKIN